MSALLTSLLQGVPPPETGWTVATAIGTIVSGVAAAIALFLNLRTLREMKDMRELSVRPYLDFSHDSFRQRASTLWQQLGEQQPPVPEPARWRQVIDALHKNPVNDQTGQYSVMAHNVGKGPAIGIYLHAYCPRLGHDGTVSSWRCFRTDWFSLGSATGTNNWEGTAFDFPENSLPPDVQQRLGLPRDPTALPATGGHDDLMTYLRDNSGEVFTYFDQFGNGFVRGRAETRPTPRRSEITMPE